MLPFAYVRAVDRAGGAPLLVPPGASVDETLDAVDGLIFSGGSDLDPELYGQEAHASTDGDRPRTRRLRGDAACSAALERDVPMLAICRGSQVLNVALGGDAGAARPGSRRHGRPQGDAGRVRRAPVEVSAGTTARRRCSATARASPSSRTTIRATAISARGLVETARAPDGTIEALEDPTKRFALGVLWHPEEGDDLRLFEALVTAAAEARAARDLVVGFLGGASRDAPRGQTKFGDSETTRPQTMTPRRRLPIVGSWPSHVRSIPPATTTSCRAGTSARRSFRRALITDGTCSSSRASRRGGSGSCWIGVRCETTSIWS